MLTLTITCKTLISSLMLAKCWVGILLFHLTFKEMSNGHCHSTFWWRRETARASDEPFELIRGLVHSCMAKNEEELKRIDPQLTTKRLRTSCPQLVCIARKHCSLSVLRGSSKRFGFIDTELFLWQLVHAIALSVLIWYLLGCWWLIQSTLFF